MIDANKNTAAPIRVDADTQYVHCSGDAAQFGHPRVFLRFDGAAFVDCYYCGRRYAKPTCQQADRAA